MGVDTSLVILSIIFFVSALGMQNPFRIQTCSDKIRQFCDCFYYPILSIRCSHKSLKEYPDFSGIKNIIEKLDISYNDLTKFPPKLINFLALETLDLSYNRIKVISQDVILPHNLRHLILSYNNISDWTSIAPNSFLDSAPNLETLSLAGNPLGAFTDNNDQLLLISGSLRKLDLSNCQIYEISGSLMLSGLMNLEHLTLHSNPLYTLPELHANKLMTLDVSKCKLTNLPPTVFSRMPILGFANFSGNHRLSLVHDNEEYVESVSLRQIDLSKCNMNAIELKGFPNLTSANLNGNLITELTDDTFENNILIENLDLSSNAISRISVMTFQWLKRIRNIDLSLNMIREIETATFERNEHLTVINLSRNFINRFRKFASPSLTLLNMSRCEITKIDEDALEDLVRLIQLDLSFNFFSELPVKFEASFLQILDLSRCRLSNIENRTFSNFPELSRLNLAGNRLTTTFRKEYFANNEYLNEIWLGDNPWRCDCDIKSHEFFKYITHRPSKLRDASQFRCYSSGNAYGVLWEVACSNYWDVIPRRISAFEKVWTTIMSILIVIILMYSAVYGLRWWAQYRKETRQEQQRQENIETSRELIRHNRMVLEQEGQLNAPDPRETHPPCYADAILMPRLRSSLTSLKQSFTSSDSINSIRKAMKRGRSEEFITQSGDARNKNRRIILAARSRKDQIKKWITSSGADTIPSISGSGQNIPSLADRAKQKSFEIITQLETENGRSPYFKRKPLPNVESVTHNQSSSLSLNEPIYANGNIVASHRCYHSEISLTESGIHQTSRSIYSSNADSYSTSSTSSFDSDEYYFNLYYQENHSSKQSEV